MDSCSFFNRRKTWLGLEGQEGDGLINKIEKQRHLKVVCEEIIRSILKIK